MAISLETHLQSIWQMLADAVASRSPFTLMQLASADQHGQPRLRTIVLREFSSTPASLLFTTDIRSAKVKEISCNPAVSLLGWDADNSVQLRLEGTASCVDDKALRLSAWQKMRPASRQMFYAPCHPGTPVTSPQQAIAEIGHHQSCEPAENFALVRVMPARIEWLNVSEHPHQRCEFLLKDKRWIAQWLAP